MACSAMKARCNGCGLSGVPRPSTVTISLPAAAHSGVSQAATACPSTSTKHAPHWLAPQPKWAAARPRGPRRTLSNGVAGSAAISRSTPLTRNRAVSADAVAISPRSRSLHRLDACLLDHVGPLVDVRPQVGIELGGAHGEGRRALFGPGLLGLRLGHHLADLRIELVDDSLGRPRRRHD